MSVTLQFHPDWPYAGGLVIESMARDGAYRSQFETGTSNGGLTARPGGDRWRWESRLFGGRYDNAAAAERPVYGAFNRRQNPYGGAIRFGSAHLRLRDEVLERCTFCFPDSVFEPTDFGGLEVLPQLSAMADGSGFDDLDECVEAHVHGGVVIERDVEAVVLDPCFENTKVEIAARELGCAVEWHPGFRVSSSALDPDYRGQEYVDLARSLGDVLTPDLLGAAARSGAYEAQSVKRIWHYLARFGRAG